MAQVGAGVGAIAEVGRRNPADGSPAYHIRTVFEKPITWAAVFAGLGAAYLIGMYFAFGGIHGDVAS